MSMLGADCSACCPSPDPCVPLRIQNFLIGPNEIDAPQIFTSPTGCDGTAVDSRGEYLCLERSVVFGSYSGSEAFTDGKLCQYTRTMQGVTTQLLSTSPDAFSGVSDECKPTTVRYVTQRKETITAVEIYEDRVTISTYGERVTYRVSKVWVLGELCAFANGSVSDVCPEAEAGFDDWLNIKPAGCADYACLDTQPLTLVTCSRSWTIPIADFTQNNFGSTVGSIVYLRDLPGGFFSSSFAFSPTGAGECRSIVLAPQPASTVDGNGQIIPWQSLPAGNSCVSGAGVYPVPAADLFYPSAGKVPGVVIV